MMRFQLVLLFAAAVGSVVLADDNLDESKASEKIGLLGGRVTRDETLPARPVIAVDFRGSKRLNDGYLHLLKSFTDLKSVNLKGNAITDDGAKQISELSNLAELWINGTQITQDGLTKLQKSLPHTVVYEDFSDESKAVATIERMGGKVTRNDKVPRPVISVDLQGSRQFTDGHVPLLKSFPSLTELDLWVTSITNVGLNEVGELTSLTSLSLGNTQITDNGLRKLHQLKKLKKLNLTGTRITGEGVSGLRECKSLTTLFLFGTNITDAGLKNISELNTLTILRLGSTRITDDALKEIAKLKQLTTIVVSDTLVTEAGVMELQEALPNAKIIR